MNCNIVRDLLPLYFDGLCSEETVAQLEEHLKQCEECRGIKEGLEPEKMPEPEQKHMSKEIAPLRKVKKTIRKKNRWIAVFACISVVLLGATAVLFYGQIAKKGVSFELLYEALRLRSVGKQFAEGNVEPLYEILYDGYASATEESSILRLAYTDRAVYDADVKTILSNKYWDLFRDTELSFEGIEELKYEVTPRIGETPVIYASLRFEDGEGVLYFIGLYKTVNGNFYAMDYFGNPYLSYESTSEGQETEESVSEYYTTRQTLFSALPNRLYDYDYSMTRYLVALKGRRALQGDTTLIENGQVPYVIFSEEDVKNNTDTLRTKLEAELEVFAAEGYYLTDMTWNVKEYDKEQHLYRGELEFELTKAGEETQKVIGMECYRVGDCFVGCSGARTVYEK